MADFTLLRLVLALAVVFAHFREINGGVSLGLLNVISSTLAVQAFFVVSGWVVASSCAASQNLSSFMVRRIARLYPLYFIVVSTQALLAVYVALTARTPWDAQELGRYLLANLAFANFLQPSLFELFTDAPVRAINPSLWTLKVETGFYLTVPLLVALVRRKGLRGIAALALASTALAYLFPAETSEFGRQLPAQLRFFLAGTICWQLHLRYRLATRLPNWGWACVAVAGACSAQLLERVPALTVVQPLLIATFVLGAAYFLPPLGRIPDLSYGVYLFHAPIIQFGRMYGFISPDGVGVVSALTLTIGLSLLASYAVEQPAIRIGRALSNRLSAQTQGTMMSPSKPLQSKLQPP